MLEVGCTRRSEGVAPAWVVGFTLFASTMFAATAMAGAAKTHDGLFLRLSGGTGTASSSIESRGENIELSGDPQSEWNFAIGGMIKPNLTLHGTYWGWLINDPDVDFNIAGFGSGSGSISGKARLDAVGGGVTYYFMPVNIYASGSVGIGILTLDTRVTGETDRGFAMDLTLGKEWWVGNSWGLGLAGGYSHHSLPDKDVSENWTGDSFALRFSATFN